MPAATEAAGRHPSPSGSETNLVVEDETGVRELAVEVLESAGFTVLAAEGPMRALEIVKQHAGRLDLLLTDVVMPQMSGRKLAERLSQERPQLRILYMSGYTDEALGAHGVLAPRTTLLAKPFTSNELIRATREALS